MDIRGKLWRLKRYLQHYFSGEIVINGYFAFNGKQLINNNFGDDINFPLLYALTKKPIVYYYHVGLRRIDNLLCIGSIIEFCDNNSIIWGSGAMFGDRDLTYKPQKVCAVRGHYTKRYLEEQGINCPDVYGDPALLMPYFYNPIVKKKYKVGIIPHYVDYNLPHVERFRETHPDTLFVCLQGYSSWKDVVCQIKSCERIISSSLHGLIISDAYGIPNIRVKFSDAISGGDFKYKDYYSGIGREYYDAIDFTGNIDLSIISSLFDDYVPINYNPKKLLLSFPYPSKLTLEVKKIIMEC